MAGESGFEVGVEKRKQSKEQETLHFPRCAKGTRAEGSASPVLMFFGLSLPSETLARVSLSSPSFFPDTRFSASLA